MAHGYMREFDEDRSRERDRWRDEDRERGWRGSERNRSDRDWRGSDRPGGDRNDRNLGFMLGDREHREYETGSGRGDWDRAPRNFSSQHDHYRSWRDRQMEALDRDYADYCREREQQFHSDFDSWRSQRHSNKQPLRTGMTQTSTTEDPTGALDLTNQMETSVQPDPTADATLGTSSGRRR
jgi:hypothetical protein